MDDDGPIAVQDFPEGCVRVTRRSSGGPSRTRPATTRERGGEREEGKEESEKSSRFMLPTNFHALTSREQFLERRKLYALLLEHYRQAKPNGQFKGRGNRPDLQAMRHMNKDETSFHFQTFGSVPGVEVGDLFDYRSEMFVVGLHRQVQGGIAWINRNGDKLACSIVVSGGYRDDIDLGDTITYAGQGGNDYKGDKRQLEDQTLERGNLALMNTYILGESVRVIRGHGQGSDWNKIHSYDGLYKITKYKYEAGKDGPKVYTFILSRLAGQPPLDTEKWKK